MTKLDELIAELCPNLPACPVGWTGQAGGVEYKRFT